MTFFLKNLIPAPMKQRAKQMLGRPLTQLHPDWSTLRPIGPVMEPHVLLDIGAHHGWFFHCWQDWCPNAQVHAFEPFPESFQATSSQYGHDPRVTLNACGVGETEGELAFNVFGASKVSNSFLRPDAQAWQTLRYETGEISQIKVPVTTVDRYASSAGLEHIYLVKIDVQGYELQVLRGAEKTLPVIDHIFVEAGIQKLYQGAPTFTEVFEFLTARGFHLMAMRAWHRGNHVLMETDMLFRRNDLAPAVDESVIKVMGEVG